MTKRYGKGGGEGKLATSVERKARRRPLARAQSGAPP